MASRDITPRLTDIVDAIEFITAEMAAVSLPAFQADRRKRWIVERGVEIISEASRHLPDELKARHPYIAWHKIAGIGNILRHEYQRIAADVLWHAVQNDFLPLEQACRIELTASRG